MRIVGNKFRDKVVEVDLHSRLYYTLGNKILLEYPKKGMYIVPKESIPNNQP